MALTLPGEVVWVLDLLGYSWPEADEDKLMECGRAWLEFAAQVGRTDGRGGSAVREVVSANSGEAVSRFSETWERFSDGPGSYLPDAQVAANVIGVGFEVAAGAVFAAKAEVIVQLVVLAVELISAQAAAPFTLGLSEVGALGVTQVTRLAVRRLLDTLKREVVEAITTTMAEAAEKGTKEIASDFMKKQVKDFATDYAKKAVRDIVVDPAKEKATNIVTGAGQDIVQQGAESHFGARDGVDLGDTLGGAKEEFGKQFGAVEGGVFKPGEYIAGAPSGSGGREGGLAGLLDPATHRDRLVDGATEAGNSALETKAREVLRRGRGEGDGGTEGVEGVRGAGGEGEGGRTQGGGGSGGGAAGDVRAVFG
ncbi:PE-PGRS family protein [Streptomyces albofaciens]|uniref:WXG100-like domain-containing protein n=1 Tax=Streptomyces albofaciens TaxID=66866 RepID=UPI00123C6E68|nr:PE-PGRS family protein [Streptomyces albofaciens]